MAQQRCNEDHVHGLQSQRKADSWWNRKMYSTLRPKFVTYWSGFRYYQKEYARSTGCILDQEELKLLYVQTVAAVCRREAPRSSIILLVILHHF